MRKRDKLHLVKDLNNSVYTFCGRYAEGLQCRNLQEAERDRRIERYCAVCLRMARMEYL